MFDLKKRFFLFLILFFCKHNNSNVFFQSMDILQLRCHGRVFHDCERLNCLESVANDIFTYQIAIPSYKNRVSRPQNTHFTPALSPEWEQEHLGDAVRANQGGCEELGSARPRYHPCTVAVSHQSEARPQAGPTRTFSPARPQAVTGRLPAFFNILK